MADVIGYLGALARVTFYSFTIGGMAAVGVGFGLYGACWFAHNWSDWDGKLRSKDDAIAEMYVIKACIFWARVAFVLGVLYALTELGRDEVQRLLDPVLGLVDGL